MATEILAFSWPIDGTREQAAGGSPKMYGIEVVFTSGQSASVIRAFYVQ